MDANADDEFDPSTAPLAQLEWHVLQKGLQAGALAGLVLGVPVAAIRHRKLIGSSGLRSFYPLAQRTVVKTTTYTALLASETLVLTLCSYAAATLSRT